MVLGQKCIFYIKTQGFWKTLCRGVKWLWRKICHLPNRVEEWLFCRRYAVQLAKRIAGKELYVLTYAFDWNIPLFQRPHQLALALARRKNTHVIFVSDQYRFDNFPAFLTVNPNLDTVTIPFLLHCPQVLQSAKHITVLKSLPLQMELLNILTYDTLIYDYIDDLSIIPCRTRDQNSFHQKLMVQADLTVCTAKVLYQDALRYARKAILVPNACDYALFHQVPAPSPNPTLSQYVTGYECVLGYYGCLEAWRLDYELILQLAREKSNWCFVLIGQCSDDSVRCLQDAKLDNIVIWPAQPHHELPHFIATFDIQIIPLKINQITKAMSPIKLFEYMAVGKPILTPAIPECMEYRSVRTYHTAEEFIATVESLLRLPPDAEYFHQMKVEAKENTWEKRIEKILENIKGSAADEG